MTYEDEDPFGSDKAPAVSFKDAAVGTSYKLRCTGKAKMLHGRDYQSGKPAYWDDNGKQTTTPTDSKVMSAVVNGVVVEGPQGVGEERSVWATKPSALFAAIAQAQKTAQTKIGEDTILTITLTGERPHDNPKMNAIKEYTAEIGTADAFAADTPPF